MSLSKYYKKKIYRRQDAPKVFDITTFFYILSCKFITQYNSLHDGKIGAIIVPKVRSIDLDTEYDLKFANFLFNLPKSRI